MSGLYLMPALGAGMESGIVVEWHVEPGQTVSRGDVIGVVDTEKGAIDIEIWEDAEIAEILAPPGTTVPVGEPLLRLGVAGDRVPDPPESTPSPPSQARRRVSPLARRQAAEKGIDLTQVTGTGPGGAVVMADVEAAEQPAAGPSDAHRQASMRRAIAAAMIRSKREIPHYYLAHTISLESSLRWLEEENLDRPPAKRILLAALYVKAVARSLEEFPDLNGFWENGAFRPGEGVHPGLAISLRGGGLVAPAVHDALTRTLEDLTEGIRDLVQRARAGRLRASEVTDPTITITSLGNRGVDAVFGVIHPPQVAMVGIGTVVERPWAERGMVGSRRTVTLTLSADHRAGDGHGGSLFLAGVARRLQTPEAL